MMSLFRYNQKKSCKWGQMEKRENLRIYGTEKFVYIFIYMLIYAHTYNIV